MHNTSSTTSATNITYSRRHRLVSPSTFVRNLGIFVDGDVTMRTHVTRTVSACLAKLRQLRSIRRSVPDSVFRSLVVSLVLSHLD